MGALDAAVRQGKALYVGISSYSAERTREAGAILRRLGTPLLIQQPSYSMINRWVEDGLLSTLEEEGIGCITFSPLAQGMLTDKYLEKIPDNSRAARKGSSLKKDLLSRENLENIRKLNGIAEKRGQTLAQMALAWNLNHPQVTSVLIGASSAGQIEENVDTLKNLSFSSDELREIDKYAKEGNINLWAASSNM